MAESFLWGLHPIELVEKILNIEEFGTVLDLGGGYGKNSLPFAQRGFDVTLVDFDSREINKLKKLIKDFGVTMKVFQENITKFKFDRKYDIILNIATLHYLEEHEAKELIKKMKEGTAKGGLNLITVFTEKNPSKDFKYLFKKGELRNFYKDWKIMEYEEYMSRLEKHGEKGKLHRHHLAVIVARKK